MHAARERLFAVITILVAVVVSLGAAEGALRLKNSSMSNYDIEMWRYARELKYPSPNPVLGHDHLKNRSALLQSVEIRTNEWGLRGPAVPPLAPGQRRILVLGSSITLGWGVREEDTLTARLQKLFAERGEDVQVLNGGIGNYNSERYVERFLTELEGLKPTDIVVQYFLRDAEHLEAGGGNVLLRYSELAVSLWIVASRLFDASGEDALKRHYEAIYEPSSRGYQSMLAALRRLADYARENHVRLYLAMTPDVHNLSNYPFGWVHDRMREVAKEDGYVFVDLLPAFGKLTPNEVWAMQGDPHPNATGHRLMAEALFPVLERTE